MGPACPGPENPNQTTSPVLPTTAPGSAAIHERLRPGSDPDPRRGAAKVPHRRRLRPAGITRGRGGREGRLCDPVAHAPAACRRRCAARPGFASFAASRENLVFSPLTAQGRRGVSPLARFF
jgi:hypothetical protein